MKIILSGLIIIKGFWGTGCMEHGDTLVRFVFYMYNTIYVEHARNILYVQMILGAQAVLITICIKVCVSYVTAAIADLNGDIYFQTCSIDQSKWTSSSHKMKSNRTSDYLHFQIFVIQAQSVEILFRGSRKFRHPNPGSHQFGTQLKKLGFESQIPILYFNGAENMRYLLNY